MKQLEINELNNEIRSKFKTSIIDKWIPAEGLLDKSCLFVKLDHQQSLVADSKDFELKLFLALEEKIKKSKFFDMIALM